jgi:type VI protein secretion system component Hcp
MPRLRLPSPALILAFVALCLALSGTAMAAHALITGKDIKDGSITSADVKNGSLMAKDFKKGQLPAGAKGDAGAAGASGAAGATGAAGAPGAAGASGVPGRDGTTPQPVDRGTVDFGAASGAAAGSGPVQSFGQSITASGPATATFTLTRATDKLSATLVRDATLGIHFPTVNVTIHRPGSTTAPQIVYALTDVVLRSASATNEQESYTLQPEQVTVTTYNADGTSQSTCHNYANNTNCGS